MIEPILIVAIAIGCTVWYMRHRWRRRARAIAMQQAMQHMSGLELLAARYARGDLDRDEYLQMKRDILSEITTVRPNVSQSRAS